MNTNNSTLKNTLSARQYAFVCLVLLTVLGVSVPVSNWTHAQDSNRRYTASLRFNEVAPGIEHGQIATGLDEEPLRVNVLRIDLKRARLKVAHALDQGVGLETVSSLARRHRADAAINGGYFRLNGTYRGESIGFLLIDGKLISEPYNRRAGVGFVNEGPATTVVFGHSKYEGNVSVARTRHTVHGINRPVAANEMVVFTPEFHRTTLTNPDGIEVVVRWNVVTAVRDLTGSSQIPTNGFVISATGKARDWIKRNVRRGSRLRFTWTITSAERDRSVEWQRAYSVLGGGPQLIKSGKIALTHVQEQMAENFATERHPRTAIGKTAGGQLLMVTVDGRQTEISVGMSLYSLADLLLELNAVEAINLDGGGSSTMVVNQRVVNNPSDQTGERPVGDAILVFSPFK